MFHKTIPLKQFAKAAVFLIIASQSRLPVLAADAATEAEVRYAWSLYTSRMYTASAVAFESLIRKATPNARLYYYAAAANKSSNQIERAKQLCQYVITNFPKSPEAASAQQLLTEMTAKSASASPALPASLNGKSADELMQTEEGRKALKEALQGQAQHSSAPSPVSEVAHAAAHVPDKNRSGKLNEQSVSAEAIANDGADGITQFVGYRDCSFECSLVSLAMQQRGQKLLANMIHSDGKGTYFVHFPGDGTDYSITPEKIEASRVHDKGEWATLIHCAFMMKFHNNYHGTLEEGLQCVTGKKAEKLFPASTTEQALSSFIEKALKAQDPVVCATTDDFGPLPELVESDQAYSIIGFEPSTGMITIRNPHGANSRRFRLTTDPEHKKFEQLNDGMFKMHVSMFPKYFSQLVSSPL